MKIRVAFVANILFSTILIGGSFHQRRHVITSIKRKAVADLTPDFVQEKPKDIPSTANLLSFGLPTLGIWLLTPILSLIDTSVVGMSSGSDVLSLAALGPGIAWIDATSYLCQFIGIATTNLYATALNEKNDIKAQQCLSHATISSLFLGVALGLLQYVFAPSIITVMAGVSTEIVPFGVKYARIRSLGALFGVPTIVGQAAFLAREDAVTPLQAVLVGAVVNLIGDVLLVSVLGMGLAGAAWATTLSQVAGAFYLICAVVKRLDFKAREEQGEGQGLLAHLRRSIHIPSVTDLKKFLSFCGPLFFVLLAKSFLWSFTTFACSKSGAVGLAAHQITINFFLFFVIFGDATSQMAQTYLPGYFAHMHPDHGASGSAGGTNAHSGGENGAAAGAARANAAKELVARISKIGLAVGAVNSAFLTKSPAIAVAMEKVAPLLGAGCLVHPLVGTLEGVLMAARDQRFHSLSYIVLGAAFLAYQVYAREFNLGLVGVWAGLALFQWMRLVVFGVRVRHLLRVITPVAKD